MVETEYGVYVQRNRSGGFMVSDTDKERAKADARLIAAAPDLLAALEEAPATLHDDRPDGKGPCTCGQCRFVRMRAVAIAKATGK
jgi:hypothetical protein